jgi:hypothetical protein
MVWWWRKWNFQTTQAAADLNLRVGLDLKLPVKSDTAM